ncbi:unnamed protein product [Cuscuta epithymum]|uniref:Uncharacterized protein n=1 Tax=Cuscuta epithymum TaxID=186058 RepID=A0AAV0E2L2_9ASTE|nr:unnamed protein product [Cuscuta epithymum]CAH9135463.1 unnamed protein product [Cuscuta epithymum]CAH9146337.1 unnamed protein product [Cuscuta epithymum]
MVTNFQSLLINKSSSSSSSNEEETKFGSELRKGPWTLEEDTLLINYIAEHGEGRWNVSAKCAGLRRTGKSCRLRWLNYLKPDIKRGNLTPQEQILILELHSKWGNRWSKIAQHMPGRTDNEIKNYWRTRVQKQARQLKIDSNSKKFIEAVKKYWMPRLVEKIEQQQNTSSSLKTLMSPSSTTSSLFSSSSSSTQPITTEMPNSLVITSPSSPNQETYTCTPPAVITQETGKTDNCNEVEDDCYHVQIMENNSCYDADEACFGNYPASMSAFDSRDVSLLGCQMGYDDWFGDEVVDFLWGQ